jgi:hypothetical protein
MKARQQSWRAMSRLSLAASFTVEHAPLSKLDPSGALLEQHACPEQCDTTGIAEAHPNLGSGKVPF